MKKKELKFVFALIAVGVLAAIMTPAENDEWVTTYERNDAGPYGSRMLFETLPALFENKKIDSVNLPPYLFLEDSSYTNTSYFFLTLHFEPDPSETRVLLDYVEAGNTVFIVAEDIEGLLADTLGVEVDFEFEGSSFSDSLYVNLINTNQTRENGYFYDATSIQTNFVFEDDSTEYSILGRYEGSGAPNFVRFPWGKGVFYLSCIPKAFTNYNMLTEKGYEYVYAALSNLPEDTNVFWDAYYKPFRSGAVTPLRFILSAPALRNALYLVLAALGLLFVFQTKRRQRPIPVIEPPENATVEFVETVGRLYFNQGNHRNLVKKLIDQWKHYVRNRLFVDVDELHAAPAERIAARAGLSLEQVEKLLERLKAAESTGEIDESLLHEMAGELDDFYKRK